MANLIDTAYKKAIDILKLNSTMEGFKASSKRYNSIWARDGAITILGAVLTGNKDLLKTSLKTLKTLKKFQTDFGQIPSVYHLKEKECRYYAMDSTIWWIIGVHQYYKSTRDEKFLKKFWPAVEAAITNLQYQVMDNSGLIDSPEASDWMDSSIGRRGKVLYTNCLFFKSLECLNELSKAAGEKGYIKGLKDLKKRLNSLFWPSEEGRKFLYTSHTKFFDEAINSWREHYVNYLSFEYYEDRCDILANSLAIIFKIASKEQAKRIIKYFERRHISIPYPANVLYPPVFYPNPTWNPKIDLYREEEQRNLSYHYHNSGIWPFVGGFYILALLKDGKKKKAKKELEKLAQANKLGKEKSWEFNEWLHGKTGKPMGAIEQSWSAAGYIIAYKALKEDKFIW